MPAEPLFQYSTAPQPLKPKKKYREDDGHFTLMSDPRVMRGSNFSTLGKTKRGPEKPTQRVHRPVVEENIDEASARPSFQFEVPPLVKSDLDLSKYLIEPSKNANVRMRNADNQTDVFKERPVTPEYVPRKTGVDVATQIEDVNDLFVFDNEVEAMLDVIVGKTIDQALFEVECEAELENLAKAAEKFEEEKQEEILWMRKQEEETIAEACVKELTLKGLKEKYNQEKAVTTLVAAKQCISQLLPYIVDDICNELYTNGTWKDPQRLALEEYVRDTVQQIPRVVDAYDAASSMIDELLQQAQYHAQLLPPEAPAKRLIKLVMHSERQGDHAVELEPLYVSDSDTMADIEARIQERLSVLGITSPASARSLLSHALGQEVDMESTFQQNQMPANMNVFV